MIEDFILLDTFPDGRLLPEQIEALDIIPNRKRIILADSTGQGKTISILASFAKLMSSGKFPRIHLLGVCTKSATISWDKDLKNHTAFEYEILLTENKAKDADYANPEGRHATILPYSALDKFPLTMRAIVEGRQFVLAVDEAHRIMNPKTRQSRLVRDLVSRSIAAWGMTATPMLNHLENLWGVIDCFFPNYLGSLEFFLQTYTVRRKRKIRGRKAKSKGGGYQDRIIMEIVGYKNTDHLKAKIEPIMLRRVRDMDIQFYHFRKPLTSEEEGAYLTAASGIIKETRTVKEFSTRLPELQLVANNSIAEDGSPNRENRLSTKEALYFAIVSKILENGYGCIVYSSRLLTIERLRYITRAAHCSLRFEQYCITGDSTFAERAEVQERHGPGTILFMSDAGGESLNLQKVNFVLFYDLPWSLGKIIQTIGRVARVDSTYKTFYAVILEAIGTIDEYKGKLMLHHTSLLQRVLNGQANLPKKQVNPLSHGEIQRLKKSLLWRIEHWRK